MGRRFHRRVKSDALGDAALKGHSSMVAQTESSAKCSSGIYVPHLRRDMGHSASVDYFLDLTLQVTIAR